MIAGKMIFDGGFNVDMEEFCDPDKAAIISLNADAFLIYMCPNQEVDDYKLIRFDITRNKTVVGSFIQHMAKNGQKPLSRGDEPVQ